MAEDLTDGLVELNYRQLHGKLFASLLALFGSSKTSTIEDAIQNAFYKSLKSWRSGQIPQNPLNWLFVVCKNDVLRQLGKQQKEWEVTKSPLLRGENLAGQVDLRMETLLFIADLGHLSVKSKILFSLKNIFGLSVTEIQQCTLLSEEAIYKNVKRTKNKIENLQNVNFPKENIKIESFPIICEILYSVFNTGFDTLPISTKNLSNIDISLEAFSLTKQLLDKRPSVELKNLLSLFCLHLARSESKFGGEELITFFRQDRDSWNSELLQLGLAFLTEPSRLDRYYLEALITSMHMVSRNHDQNHWQSISDCYQLLEKVNNSPIIKINHAFALYQSGHTKKANSKLSETKNLLPENHLYQKLVEAEIIQNSDPSRSQILLIQSLNLTELPWQKKLIKSKISRLQVVNNAENQTQNNLK